MPVARIARWTFAILVALILARAFIGNASWEGKRARRWIAARNIPTATQLSKDDIARPFARADRLNLFPAESVLGRITIRPVSKDSSISPDALATEAIPDPIGRDSSILIVEFRIADRGFARVVRAGMHVIVCGSKDNGDTVAVCGPSGGVVSATRYKSDGTDPIGWMALRVHRDNLRAVAARVIADRRQFAITTSDLATIPPVIKDRPAKPVKRPPTNPQKPDSIGKRDTVVCPRVEDGETVRAAIPHSFPY
jgi:hypothetical protein